MPYVKQPDGTVNFERRMKKGVFIAVAGTDQELNTILATVKGFFNWANIELVEKILYTHEDDELGRVKYNKELMNQVLEIGARITKNESS
jgi:hypothetical protein